MFKAYAIDLGTTFFGSNPISAYKDQPITDLISAILPNVYVFAGIILFIYLVFGGFLIITSGSNTHNLEEGQGIILNAIIGFILIFASYWIIQIIEILTGLTIV